MVVEVLSFDSTLGTTGEIRNEVGCLGGRAVFAGPHHRRDRRSLDPLDPSGVLSAHATVRGISNSARDYAPSARRTAQEAGPAGRPASHSVPGIAQAARIYPDPKRPRPVPNHDGVGALGRYPHGG